MGENKGMQIGELSKMSGVPRHTIHYYLKKGILHPPKRTSKTRAYYNASHLKRLRVIKNVQRDYNSPLAFIASRFGSPGKAEKNDAAAEELRSPAATGRRRKKVRVDPEKKQKIIDAGLELFSTKGYYRTSVKDITDYLGFSTGAFYIYFKSKGDLFHEVVTKGIKTIVDELEATVHKEEDVLIRNTLRFEALNLHYLRFNEILTQLRLEILGQESSAEESLEKVYFELTRPFTREINMALEQNLIRPVDPDLLTFCLMGMCDMLLFRKSLDDKYDLNQIVAFLFDLLQKGLDRELVVLPAGNKEALRQAPAIDLTDDDEAFLSGLRKVRYNQAKYAEVLGKSRQSITNYLRRRPYLKKIIEKEKYR